MSETTNPGANEGGVVARVARETFRARVNSDRKCQGADFSAVAAHLGRSLIEHADRDGLNGVLRAVFLDRGGHAPGEACPTEPQRRPVHAMTCDVFTASDRCTCGAGDDQ